jgi:hypothetical protein
MKQVTFFAIVVTLAGADAPAMAEEIPRFVISTIAGDGTREYGGDGKPATEASLEHPTSVAVNSKGIVYIGDSSNHRVRVVDEEGIMTTFMGTGATKMQDKYKKARKTNLVSPYGVAVDGADNVYVLSRGHTKIFKIALDGKISVIGGFGKPGYNGDGIPATEARFQWANHLVAAPNGDLYVADTGNHRIRKIDTDGIVHTVGGNGEAGFSGDGGPATEARINAPSAIAMDQQGNIFIADFENHRIRMIDTEGIITTIAGTGEPKFNGDDLPALEGNIGEPCGVAVDNAGYVYIGDQVNFRVRVVTPGGRLHTVAGIGKVGTQGNGGPAEMARISNPDIIVFDKDENLYIPDNMNGLVRKLTRVK